MSTTLMTGKTVFVTGGGSGIGAAVARLCAEEGAEAVVVTDRDGDAAASVAKSINTDAGRDVARAFALDVTNRTEVDAIVARIQDDHGRLDCASTTLASPDRGAGSASTRTRTSSRS